MSHKSIGSATASGGNIYFGVVGEGKSKRILGYGSSFSSSTTSVMLGNSFIGDNNNNNSSSWVCTYCCYDNIDSSNDICSMCGNKRVVPSSSAPEGKRGSLPSLIEGRVSGTQIEFDSPLPMTTPAGDNISTGSLSREGSFRLSSLQNEGDTAGPPTDEEFVKRIAHQSIQDCGGWTCETCTFVNRNEDHLSCEVCGAQRRDNVVQGSGGSFYGHNSMEDFFSASMRNALENEDMERQLELARGVEEQVTERENMAQLIVHQKQVMAEIVLQEARARKHEQDQLRVLETAEGRETYLSNLTEKLRKMEIGQIQEREEIHAMEVLQRERKQQIEQNEGVASVYDLVGGGATLPGVHHVSVDAVEWIAQQRMLDDWKDQLSAREQETEGLRQMSLQAREELIG